MKQLVFFLFLSAFVFPSRAQTPSKKEKAFLDALNRLITGTKQNHWHYDEPMKVDSIFHLTGDTLSITWLYTTDSSWIKTRLAAPFSKIGTIDWDHYLVLNFHDQELVHVYEQTNREPAWQLVEQRHLLHVAVVNWENKKEIKMKQEIEKAFEKIKGSK